MVVIRPHSSFRIPIRNPPKQHCSFPPLFPLLSQCGYSLKSEYSITQISLKPIVINRRARLGSVLNVAGKFFFFLYCNRFIFDVLFSYHTSILLLLLLLFPKADLSALESRLPLGPKGQWASCQQN